MSIASQNMRLMMSCDQALLGKLIRSLGFFGCCEMCRLMVRASPQHLLHWATSAVDWLSALEWQCLEAQVMDELSHCIRQPCKWRHSSEKKKQTEKQMWWHRNSRQGWKGPLHTTEVCRKAGGVPTFPWSSETNLRLSELRKEGSTSHIMEQQLLGNGYSIPTC